MVEGIFSDRLLNKLDKIDRATLQTYLKNIALESQFNRSALNALPEGIILLNANLRIQSVSRGAKTILGISHSVDPRKRIVWDILSDEGLESLLRTNLQPNQQLVQYEIEVLSPKHAYVSVSSSPFYAEDEITLMGYIVLLTNTTLPRHNDREKMRVEKTESLLSLADGIAHEIGNPLNAIGLHLQLLEKELAGCADLKSEKMKSLVETALSETERLNRMVKNFLKVTRRKKPLFKETDINELILTALRVFEPELSANNIQYDLKLSNQVPSMLLDPEKIHQVLLNLLKNAIESMSAGGNLKIGSAKNDKVCTIQISDEGNGIDETDLPHVFEAYFTTKDEGSGLGLIIVRDIIEEHGGRIEIKPNRPRGTTVLVNLPIRTKKLALPEMEGN